ncbi:DEAD/DEAH box helicase [Halalkalicoccus jeotgali]|uniref:Hef nuclease n=1 Tax=Halalkalicoccus jeotgali (strain DSM 18796 / CECT 7217 / JCM 14584 / KCTC 4019 / B3) TaxID=795797 RepID=D8J4J0_HALJB|nr:DEAD/DEAH box helicase [Halalkalicoccus jeotgali]ADJ13552.1 Hef nuclease [Halalkalicoccus jeotgali B3]ELY32974.1 Hef nuclease [Halalkalicoccus jeotgali B3]
MAATDEQVPRVDHPLLTPGFIERRLYQIQLAGRAKTAHTLVCLPTGLGKTTVSLLVTAERLNDVGGKSLFLAPTKPLVEQHAEFYREALEIPDEEIVVFTGEVRPDDRAALWDDSKIVIATPQVVENDLVGGRISLADVTHLTFDECHRATGDYSYVYIAERYHGDAENPLVTGMSASPGGDEEAILEVCENLGISEVEVMTEEDSDVAEYTHDTEVEWKRIEVPEEIIEIRDALNEVVKDRLEKLKEIGVIGSARVDISRKELFGVRSELQKLIQNDQSEGYTGMSIHAEVMKLKHAVEVVESQGVEALEAYFERLRNEARSSGASKASQRLVSEPKVREAMRRADEYDDLHPKLSETRRLAIETLVDGGRRVIVFTEYRDTAETLTEFLGEHVDTRRFVGQGDKEGSSGMTQKEQKEVLDDFRKGEFEVLVSTSVAEEGLDVPEVDLVLFYEPVPTAIRAIQRKGRTGRQDEGQVVVLLAEDTRDEAYFWISRRREKEMESELRKLKGVASEVEEQLDPSQRQLADFDAEDGGSEGDDVDELEHGLESYEPEADDDADGSECGSEEGAIATPEPDPDGGIEIVADQRELDATIARDLSTREGISTRLETLAVGDYVLSDRVAVERKSVSDFLDTLVGGDRSVFEQVGDMARFYSRPVVIIEGAGLYEERNVHPNAIRGALASLAIDFGASVLRTEDEADTADLLAVIAGREQEVDDREVSVHGKKSSKTLAEQQEYVVGSIADIGPVTARSLLEAFGSVEAVLTASEEELMDAEGVGEVTAGRIREVVAGRYESYIY